MRFLGLKMRLEIENTAAGPIALSRQEFWNQKQRSGLPVPKKCLNQIKIAKKG